MQSIQLTRRLLAVGVVCLFLCGWDGSSREQHPHNCRFWGGIGTHIPGAAIADHLSELPYSIKNLSIGNRNGWSIVHYFGQNNCSTQEPDEPVVRRGLPPAREDSLFSVAVDEAVLAEPKIAISHIRYCSSGLCSIPNPHPFERVWAGKHWFFAHNGAIDITVLMDLIRPDFLAAHQPEHGSDLVEWIDSELYFLFILQCMTDCNWRAERGIGYAIDILRQAIPGSHEMLNFVLTDCQTMWGYREGISLYYLYETEPVNYTVIASRYPSQAQDNWIELLDGQLIIMTESQAPTVVNIEEYFTEYGIDESDYIEWTGGESPLVVFPNPFSSVINISCELLGPKAIQAQVFDISGRLVRVIQADAHTSASEFRMTWDGCNDYGQLMPSGIYFCRLTAGEYHAVQRLSLLR